MFNEISKDRGLIAFRRDVAVAIKPLTQPNKENSDIFGEKF